MKKVFLYLLSDKQYRLFLSLKLGVGVDMKLKEKKKIKGIDKICLIRTAGYRDKGAEHLAGKSLAGQRITITIRLEQVEEIKY